MLGAFWNGLSIWVLEAEPDWRRGFRCEATVPTITEDGLTGREGRRQLGETLRLRLTFEVIVSGAAARAFAAGLRDYQNQPVVVPLWPFAVAWADRADRPVSGGLSIVFREDWSRWELFGTAEPGWPHATDLLAPALWGRLERRELAWLTPDCARLSVDFVEASPATMSLEIAEATFADGPAPSGAWETPPKLFPLSAHHDQPTGGFSVSIQREEIGFGREAVETLYPQATTRLATARHVAPSLLEAARLLRFFRDHGMTKAFWIPSVGDAALLASDVAPGATTVAVADPPAVKALDWLGFVDGDTVTPARVESIDGNVLTLDRALPALAARRTIVAQLILARFDRPRLTLEWLSPTVAQATIPARELPPEYTPASGETLGESLGALAVRAYLYELREPASDGSTTVHRFTSFEKDLEVDGETYTAAPVQHGQVRRGLALDCDDVEVQFAIAEGDTAHPFVRMATLRSVAPLRIKVRALDLVLPS